MKKRRNEIDERRVQQLLTRIARRVPLPPDHELRAMAWDAAASPRAPLPGAGRARPWRPFHLRWGLVVAAALIVGSGFGFSLGSRDASSGSAGTNVVGFGFLSATGWTVVQSGAVGPGVGARAIAANVPLRPERDPRAAPEATLSSLPSDGVLILATFTARGDPAEDMKFAERELPLQISGAKPVSPSSDSKASTRRLAHYRLRAAVGGYNVEARIYFGTVPASETMLDTAQRQLNRLVVASERVTIVARPSIVPMYQRVTAFGSVDSGKEGELVTVQAKDCGSSPSFFRDVATATTREGGGWSTEFLPRINTTLRAVWKDAASAPITVRQRPVVVLRRQRLGRGFEVWISAKAQFWRKRVLFQRFDPQLGTWATVRSVVLTETGTNAPGYGYAQTWAKFSAPVRKGVLVRAVLPRSQARPCYLAGYSKLLRT